MTLTTAAWAWGLALLLRAIDGAYHRDRQRVLRHLGLAPRGAARDSYYRRCDPIFAVLPFGWNWLEISVAVAMAAHLDHATGWMLLIAFAAARFRALQEVGHTAVHFGLCRARRWQWCLGNVFFQYPCLKPDMAARCVAHVRLHHRNANRACDPNIARFQQVGFLPGLTRRKFYAMLFHPLTPAGAIETLRAIAAGVSANDAPAGALLRGICVSAVAGLLFAIGGWQGLAFGYVIPLLTIYPWFSWISLLVEHRWFVDCQATDRYTRECVNARPTDYPGLSGWLLKHFVFPATDHYHLAHSLYPHVRWNYMPAIDRVLKARDPRYAAFRSEGLLWKRGPIPSALSELQERMTNDVRSDLAPWAVALSEGHR